MKLMKILQEMKPKPGGVIDIENAQLFERVLLKPVSEYIDRLDGLNLRMANAINLFYGINLDESIDFYYVESDINQTLPYLINKKYFVIDRTFGGLWDDHEERIKEEILNKKYKLIK